MKIIAISQRVTEIPEYAERRDSLDQRWLHFLQALGYVPLLIPNQREAAQMLLSLVPVEGVILSGGNDLEKYGGNTPERDATERMLIQYSMEHSLPLIGVCRGMQMILDFFGVELIKVDGHIGGTHTIYRESGIDEVNSFHRLGVREKSSDLFVDWAIAEDGVIEAVTHREHCIYGIMWHPERFPDFRPSDLSLFAQIFDRSGVVE
jgi:putative glutamine amidotransferase